MGVPVLNKVGLILILLSFGFFSKKEKVAVPRIQRAVVVENQAIIYTQPDFDAEQIMKLPNNKIIAISTKIYRPKNLFGSFYRIFINKPRKIRGYISEIDVLPQYKRAKDGYVLNKEYQQKEQVLKQVKTELIQTEKKTVQSGAELPDGAKLSQKTSQEVEISKEVKPSENKVGDKSISESAQQTKQSEAKKEPVESTEKSIKDSETPEESAQENPDVETKEETAR